MDLWAECREAAVPGPLAGELVRMVESQEQVATTALVDDLAEQVLLEALLETTKPALRPGTEGLHYLLATPFRYPPLPHGSRFGAVHEPGLLYGARALPTALAETAYYRFVFWEGMAAPPASGKFLSQHTAFGARYRTARGLRLQEPPCNAYQDALRDPGAYTRTQPLGAALRGEGVEAIEFVSARDRTGGLNVALFQPAALADEAPLYQAPWLCETRPETVSFSSARRDDVHAFARAEFLVEGRLPQPAL